MLQAQSQNQNNLRFRVEGLEVKWSWAAKVPSCHAHQPRPTEALRSATVPVSPCAHLPWPPLWGQSRTSGCCCLSLWPILSLPRRALPYSLLRIPTRTCWHSRRWRHWCRTAASSSSISAARTDGWKCTAPAAEAGHVSERDFFCTDMCRDSVLIRWHCEILWSDV